VNPDESTTWKSVRVDAPTLKEIVSRRFWEMPQAFSNSKIVIVSSDKAVNA
jgi:hypothetical protein